MPFISICIPAYKRTAYLNRLLQSVLVQDFKDFEVVVTDDSPDTDVKELCSQFESKVPLTYHQNPVALGTPANWNKAISLATGHWIKLMHDDDWFAAPDSLQQFADCAATKNDALIFSAYTNVFENSGQKKLVFPEKLRLLQAQKEPAILVARNFIGPPSVTMHRNDGNFMYDPRLKWLVDIDMYRRRIEANELIYLPRPLVNVGMSDSQVTSYTKNIGAVEIPEHFHFLNKMGIEKLKNILVYDYNWRFIRNFKLRQPEDIRGFGYNGTIPQALLKIMTLQSKLPAAFLKNGISSKILMTLHFLMNRKNLR